MASAAPERLSVCTYNLWNTQRWPEREPALRQFLECFTPDVLATQELRAETRDCIDAVLTEHERVADAFVGWTNESNIWWRSERFAYVEHGAADYGSHEASRRLFWVRLRVQGSDRTCVMATAHLTHQSHPDEAATGASPRIQQTRAILETMAARVGPGEPAWVMGDFNDALHPTRLLHAAGYTSCYTDLAVQPPPTFPALPTARRAADEPLFNVCYDWITANAHARAICAQTPHCFYGDGAPSDHWPVVAVYELRQG